MLCGGGGGGGRYYYSVGGVGSGYVPKGGLTAVGGEGCCGEH